MNRNNMQWDLFCRVVDNFGDIGICWRLAQQLTHEHQVNVRLWVDDLNSFSKLCRETTNNTNRTNKDEDMQIVDSVTVCRWSADLGSVEKQVEWETSPSDVVIEAFACELPSSFIAAMACRTVPPVWINLEYLSAEAWVDECHLLISPHPSVALKKYFFFPGFTPKTGGLLRERALMGTRAAFDSVAAAQFLRELGIARQTETEILVSLFCYENAALPGLLRVWADGPETIRVLATPGAATEQITRWLGRSPSRFDEPQRTNSLIVQPIPFLSQSDYDRLLWSCDVNFVRGEDSFVRAQWAQKPFVWQIYPQAESSHLVKLDAFLGRFLEKSPSSDVIRRFWQAWNGAGDITSAWREFIVNHESVEQLGKDWARQLDRTSDLANNLVCFVRKN